MGQVRFENFDFLVKVKGPLGQSIFFFFFFFLFKIFCSRFGSGQVSRSVKPVSGGDVIRDVIALGACVSAWRVERVKRVRGLRRRVTAREKTLMIAEPSGCAWKRVAVHLDLKFSGLVYLRPLKTPVGSVV